MPGIDELNVGDSAELAKTVTEADIVTFAGVTGDFNPVHIDAVAAKASMFGERIAHGILSAGFISAVIGMRLPGPGSVYLSQTLRFTKPVRIGDTVTARVEVLEVLATTRRVRLATTCRNQNGDVVVDGEAVVMIEKTTRGEGS
jgi:3-hydroxybutyryl-CoA dehydratase